MAERDQEQLGLCDIDHRRPAVVRVTVSQNGKRRTLNVCEEHYAALRQQQSSPFESLFGGSLFGGDMMRDFFGEGAAGGDGDVSVGRGGRPGRAGRGQAPAGRDRESIDVGDYLSEQAEEILQAAARTAAEWGAREVDSEHLLFALADNDVVQAILSRFKLSPEELKRQVQEISPRRERKGARP